MKTIAILGSTGSIGTQTLEVVRENQDIRVAALAAGNNIALLEQQIREFTPKTAAVWTEEKAKELRERVKDLPLPNRNQGFSGRFTYDYKHKYLVEVNFGYNGTERLGKNDQKNLY